MVRYCSTYWEYSCANRIKQNNRAKISQINKSNVKRQNYLPTMIGVNELIKAKPVMPQQFPVILMVQCQWWVCWPSGLL